MPLDAATCYRALQTRDARFDGRFFTGVSSTGVFCRPVCPARTPHRKNCEFYPSAAAALDAGFRPCLRCRPETAPGAPAWNGTSAVVSRALRLIEQGALDRGSLPELCDRLGVGDRHLRRLFLKHLGAGPSQVAQSRRLLFAKRLLTETAMPVSQAAHSAGFGSARRLHEAVTASYGRPPSALRGRRGGESGAVELRLAFRPPYHSPLLLAFLEKRAMPGVEEIDGNVYRRSIRLGDEAGRLQAEIGEQDLKIRLDLPPSASLLQAVDRVRRMFDLTSDPVAVQERFSADPVLGPLVASRLGLRIPGAWDGFELAVRAVLGQQVSVAGARTLATRIVDRFGESLPGDSPNRLFPQPGALAEAPLEEVGLTGKRAETIREIARCEGRDLAAVSGVGPWTREYVALRMGDPDAFPASDLVLRKAYARLTGRSVTAKELERAAEPWRPWRGYAALYLWTAEAPHVV